MRYLERVWEILLRVFVTLLVGILFLLAQGLLLLTAILATVGVFVGIVVFIRQPDPQILIVFGLPVVSGFLAAGLNRVVEALSDWAMIRFSGGQASALEDDEDEEEHCPSCRRAQ